MIAKQEVLNILKDLKNKIEGSDAGRVFVFTTYDEYDAREWKFEEIVEWMIDNLEGACE